MSTIEITKANLIKQVRIVLDQNESNTPLSTLGDTDQLQTDDIIEQCLQYAFDRVLDQAPYWMIPELIDKAEKTMSPRRWRGAYTAKHEGAKCEAPADMYKPISVSCAEWELPVFEFVDKSDPKYAMQKSEFFGIRGTNINPVVSLTHNPEDVTDKKLYFEIWGAECALEQKAYISYVKKLSVASTMQIPSLILQSIVYTTANLYYVTLGNHQMAEMMAAEARESLTHNRVDEENGK